MEEEIRWLHGSVNPVIMSWSSEDAESSVSQMDPIIKAPAGILLHVVGISDCLRRRVASGGI